MCVLLCLSVLRANDLETGWRVGARVSTDKGREKRSQWPTSGLLLTTLNPHTGRASHSIPDRKLTLFGFARPPPPRRQVVGTGTRTGKLHGWGKNTTQGTPCPLFLYLDGRPWPPLDSTSHLKFTFCPYFAPTVVGDGETREGTTLFVWERRVEVSTGICGTSLSRPVVLNVIPPLTPTLRISL